MPHEDMTRFRQTSSFGRMRLGRLVGIGCLIAGTLAGCAETREHVATAPQAQDQSDTSRAVKTSDGISGNRTIIGTVTEVTAEQIKVNTGEVQPRFLPLGIAQEKGQTVRKGEKLEILLNEQNLVVDFHPATGDESSHRIVKGQLSAPLTIGQDHAMLRTESGQVEGYEVRPLVRSKVAAIPVGVPAVFLIDESNKIADATFGSREAVEQAQAQWQNKSPIKGAHQRVEGTVMRPLESNQITIRTEDGREQPFGVRDIARGKLSKVDEGQRVTLMVDNDNQVIDVAMEPHTSQ